MNMTPQDPNSAAAAQNATKIMCPVCRFEGEPGMDEKWNGIRGPGARVVSRRWTCPQCSAIFANPEGWKITAPASPEPAAASASETPTPETDAAKKWTFGDNRPSMSFDCVTVDFARSLERRLTAEHSRADKAEAERDKAYKVRASACRVQEDQHAEIGGLTLERDKLRSRLAKAEHERDEKEHSRACAVKNVKFAQGVSDQLRADLAEMRKYKGFLAWLLKHTKIVYFDADYPVEHNMAANKNSEMFLYNEFTESPDFAALTEEVVTP